ncbi:MAG: ABC transporter ATP-binding protein [Pseudoxanthomonas sp.]
MTSYRKLWDLFDRRGRLGLLGLLLLMLVAALIEALAITAAVPFLSVLGGRPAATPGVWLGMIGKGGNPAVVTAVAFTLTVVLAVALKALADYVTMAFSWAQSARWSRRLLRVYLNREYDWFLGEHSANLGYALLQRVQEVVSGSLLPALKIIVNALVVVCILGVLLPAAPAAIFLVTGVVVALYSAVFVLLRRKFTAVGVEKEGVAAARFRLVSELFAGIKEIKLHGLEADYDANARHPFQRFAALLSQRHWFSVLPRYVLEALGFVALALVVLLLGRSKAGLESVVPLLGLLGFAAFRLLPAVQQVYVNVVSLPIGLPALDAVHRDLAGGDAAVPSKPVPMELCGAIELQGVHYAYPGSERAAIDGLDLRIEAGSMVALAGRSGAGKSTIADFTMGLLQPVDGALRIDGVVLDRAGRRAWQAGCGYVAQQVFLLDDSIAANIAFGVPEASRDMQAVAAAARSAALHDFIQGLPDGFDTRVGERGVRLSGGQRQRIGIARALYRDAAYLVLDEATNALDPGTEAEVLAVLEKIRGSRTILVIAHRLSSLERCDRVLLIEDGKLVADGSYEALLRDSPQFRRFANAGDNSHDALRTSV